MVLLCRFVFDLNLINEKMTIGGTVKTIATHSGGFHADESLAVYLLKVLPQYANATVVRTRDPAVIDKADIVVDVGGVYDHSKRRYDHHQREFNDTFDQHHSIRLSSAGLVYKHYGQDVIQQLLGLSADQNTVTSVIFQKVYDDLIEGYDGVDNGVQQYPADIVPAYVDKTSISHRVGALNPNWNDSFDDLDERFMRAVALTGAEFKDRVLYLAKAWLPAREIVLKAWNDRKKSHPSGAVLILDHFCPWKEHLSILEKEGNEKALYVIYEDTSKQWRIQAVPEREGSFVSRKALPEQWRGLRDDELSSLSGIDGCVFVHASGFIGGNKSKVIHYWGLLLKLQLIIFVIELDWCD